jgi:small-conductance mechanosensitive channel
LITAVYAGTLQLTLPRTAGATIVKIFFIGLLLQIARLGSHAIKFLLDRYRRQEIEKNAEAVTTLSSVAFLLRILLWVILFLVALDNFGVNVTTLIAGLGVGGIAMALAVQNILGDLFASFSIVLDKPFVIGDFIIVGDYLGTVEYVGLKTTRIRSLSGEQLIFSNTDLLSSRIRNFKRMYERRVVFSIGVLYQTPVEQVEKIPSMIRDIIEHQNQVRFDRAHFKEYGEYSLNFEVVYWIQNPDYNVYMDIQQAINIALYKRFDKAGIEFAYPTQTLYFPRQHKNWQSPMNDQSLSGTAVGSE